MSPRRRTLTSAFLLFFAAWNLVVAARAEQPVLRAVLLQGFLRITRAAAQAEPAAETEAPA